MFLILHFLMFYTGPPVFVALLFKDTANHMISIKLLDHNSAALRVLQP